MYDCAVRMGRRHSNVELGLPVYTDQRGRRSSDDYPGRRRLSMDYPVLSDRRRSSMSSFITSVLSEELEDAVSIYDDIEDNHYDDLNDDKVYLEVLGDEPEGCDQDSKPELPSPRSGSTSQEQNQVHDYEGLKKKKPDHTYVHVTNDETEGCDEDRKVEDHDQDTELQEKDNPSTIQDRDSDTQDQSHEQATKRQ